MELHNCINFLLTKAQNAVLQHFKAELQELGITPGQYAILKCLWDGGSQTPSSIAQTISLDGSTITGLLDRLELKALLRRVPNPEDRRTLQIELTEQGRALQGPVEERMDQANEDVISHFSPEDQINIQRLLNEIAKIEYA